MPVAPTILAALTEFGWRPGIGDPTILGWVTAISYFLAAGACFLAARKERWLAQRTLEPVSPRFWLILAIAMLALGINKQLDLQTALTEIGRMMARRQGWYAIHRTVQGWFILAVASAGVLVIAVASWFIRRTWRRHGLALAGLVFLVCFVAIRAASFHHVDHWLGRSVFYCVNLNVTLELGGILLVAAGAIGSICRRP